jgi:hypothetical protein
LFVVVDLLFVVARYRFALICCPLFVVDSFGVCIPLRCSGFVHLLFPSPVRFLGLLILPSFVADLFGSCSTFLVADLFVVCCCYIPR